MRKAMIYVSIPFMVLILGTILVSMPTSTQQTAPVGAAAVLPTSPMTAPTYDIPLCENEDGSGQMLCMWDAAYSGDGQGVSVVAGDCSLDTVGSEAAQEACTALWMQPSRVMDMGDGAVSETSKGSVLVDDCLTIEWEIETGTVQREEGWTLTECFKAHME